MYRDMRYVVDLRHSLQPTCGVASSNRSAVSTVFENIDPVVEAVGMWNPEGISKRSGKGGKPVLSAPRSSRHTWIVSASLDSAGLHASQDTQLAADPNPTATIELTAAHDAVVSGLVEDDQSHAIAGATVSILGGESGLTKPDGSFTLKANAAIGQEVRLRAEKPRYLPVDQDHPAGRGDATIVLTPLPPHKRH